jgi:hypothetical protein
MEGPWYCYLWKYVADENMPKIDITMNTDIVPLKMVVSGQVVTADVGEGSTQDVLFISRYGVYTLHRIKDSILFMWERVYLLPLLIIEGYLPFLLEMG